MSCFTALSASAVLPICPKPLRLVRFLEPRTPGAWPDACWACLAASLCRAGWNSLWANSKSRGTGACSPSAVSTRLLFWSADSTENFQPSPLPPSKMPSPHAARVSSGLCLTRMLACVCLLHNCCSVPTLVFKGSCASHPPDPSWTPSSTPTERTAYRQLRSLVSRGSQISNAERTGDGGQRAHSSAPTHPAKEEATHSHLLRISSQRQSPAAPLLANPQRRDSKPTPGWHRDSPTSAATTGKELLDATITGDGNGAGSLRDRPGPALPFQHRPGLVERRRGRPCSSHPRGPPPPPQCELTRVCPKCPSLSTLNFLDFSPLFTFGDFT